MSLVLPDEFMTFLEHDSSQSLRADVVRWCQWRTMKVPDDLVRDVKPFEHFFSSFPEFRVLVDYRCDRSGFFSTRFRLEPRWPRRTELVISAKSLGPSTIIAHGHGSIILAESIGSDFVFNQLVTVGHDGKTGIPTIGSKVTIRTGAVVVGKITIGNNVMIGANAVVNFDVPDRMRVYAPRAVMKPM